MTTTKEVSMRHLEVLTPFRKRAVADSAGANRNHPESTASSRRTPELCRTARRPPDPRIPKTPQVAFLLLRRQAKECHCRNPCQPPPGALPLRRCRLRQDHADGSLLRHITSQHQVQDEDTLPQLYAGCPQAPPQDENATRQRC